MTLSTTTTRASASGNGSTVDFNFTFKVWAASDLKVYLRDTTTLVDTLQTLTTHYTVVPTTSYPDAGKITFVTAPATGKTVIIMRDAAMTQDLDLIANGAFAAENVEAALDKIVGFAQSLEERDDRALLLPVGSSLSGLSLPEPTLAKAGRAIGINNTGDGFTDISATIAAAAVSAFAATLLDDTTIAAFFTTLGFLTGSVTTNLGSIADNASQAFPVTVTGAASGDWVVGVSASGDLATTAGIVLSGKVSSANTVTVQVENDSGGAFDAASQTFLVLVLKKSSMGL